MLSKLSFQIIICLPTAVIAVVGGIDPPIPVPVPVPPIPIPDPAGYQDPLDPSTWNGIPDNISNELALDSLGCIDDVNTDSVAVTSDQ